jgi:hypothetical protein
MASEVLKTVLIFVAAATVIAWAVWLVERRTDRRLKGERDAELVVAKEFVAGLRENPGQWFPAPSSIIEGPIDYRDVHRRFGLDPNLFELYRDEDGKVFARARAGRPEGLPV